MQATEIAAALGRPEREGKGWRCVCPLHGGHSLCVRDGDLTVLVRCWGGCDSLDVLRELRRLGLLGDHDDAGERREMSPARDAVERSERINLARSLWRGSSPLPGTLAERYLAARGIVNVGSNPSLRFLPAYRITLGCEPPALVAAVASPDRTITAVQLTFLSHDGDRKADIAGGSRRTFGVLGDSAVRLAAAGEVLGLCEGTESALSAMAQTGVPTWAALGAARLHQVKIPDGVRDLIVFADFDEPGMIAAERVFDAHPGLSVDVRLPPGGEKDWNDALVARGRSA